MNNHSSISDVISFINKNVGDNPLVLHTDLCVIYRNFLASHSEHISPVNFFDYVTSRLSSELTSSQVFIPSFSYSFTTQKSYSVNNTPSDLGAFSEYLRKQSKFARTLDPIFNHILLKSCDSGSPFLQPYCTAFGTNSFYDCLTSAGAYVFFWGVDPNLSNTYIHHIESMFDVPYRYTKKFSGTIHIGDTINPIDYNYYVRPQSIDVSYDNQGIDLTNPLAPLLQCSELTLIGYSTNLFFDHIYDKLSADPFYLLSSASRQSLATQSSRIALIRESRHFTLNPFRHILRASYKSFL